MSDMEDDYEYSDNGDNQEDDVGTGNDKYPVDSSNDNNDYDDDEEDEYEEDDDDDDNDTKMEWRNSNENPNAAPMSFRGKFPFICSFIAPCSVCTCGAVTTEVGHVFYTVCPLRKPSRHRDILRWII